MSQWNGDKARHNRERKKNIHRRLRTRELLAEAAKPKQPAIIASTGQSNSPKAQLS
jgi:hypothetical protein